MSLHIEYYIHFEEVTDKLKPLMPWLKCDLNFSEYKHFVYKSYYQILYFNDNIL